MVLAISSATKTKKRRAEERRGAGRQIEALLLAINWNDDRTAVAGKQLLLMLLMMLMMWMVG